MPYCTAPAYLILLSLSPRVGGHGRLDLGVVKVSHRFVRSRRGWKCAIKFILIVRSKHDLHGKDAAVYVPIAKYPGL